MTHARHTDTPAASPCPASPAARMAAWTLQIIAAAILAQTLFFKFTGARESVFIFTQLGVEPWGRLFAGVSELVAVVLLLRSATAPLGAAMAIGIMLGAIGAHLAKLGVVVQNDGGLLFGLAVTVLLSSIGVLVLRRRQAAALLRRALTMIGKR